MTLKGTSEPVMTYCCYEQQFHMKSDQFANIFHNIHHFSDFQRTFTFFFSWPVYGNHICSSS